MSGSLLTAASSAPAPFRAGDGKILDPNGAVFTARGIALNPAMMDAADTILVQFPGLNFVRLTEIEYRPPAAYAAFIDKMTARGIVVELEDHRSSDGANQGGSRGTAFTGQLLADELNWYSSIADAFKSNPYVWFGTTNEPPNEGLTTWQKQTYDAIRNAGNNNPIMLELPGGGYPDAHSIADYGMDPAVYVTMTNVIVDVHLYGWSSDYEPDQQMVNATLTGLVDAGATMRSADGAVPVLIGEYGISTDGDTLDANADQVVRAVHRSVETGETSGAVAFTWAGEGEDILVDEQGRLTLFGQQVAQWIETSSGQGGTPTLPSVTPDQLSILLSGDSYQGAPRFMATIDGETLTPSPLAVSAVRGAGTQSFAFTGNWGSGGHDVEISFVNDLWGGTPDTDRNVYVEQVYFNGTSVMTYYESLFSDGSVVIKVG